MLVLNVGLMIHLKHMLKIILKKVECHENEHADAAAYIQQALGRHQGGGMWHRIHMLLKPYRARLCVAPHPTGLGVYLMTRECPPVDIIKDIQMQIHFRHRTRHQPRAARVGNKNPRRPCKSHNPVYMRHFQKHVPTPALLVKNKKTGCACLVDAKCHKHPERPRQKCRTSHRLK